MKADLLTDHLTVPQGDAMALLQASTFPGMAHWGGTGPEGVTCRQCEHWQSSHGYKRAGDSTLADRRCRRFSRMMGGMAGPGVPHDAKACSFFEVAEKPPRLEPGRAPKEPAPA